MFPNRVHFHFLCCGAGGWKAAWEAVLRGEMGTGQSQGGAARAPWQLILALSTAPPAWLLVLHSLGS